MGNTVGKAREHERYQRLQEDSRSRVKLTVKRLTDEELSNRILALVRKQPIPERNLGPLLRLSVIDGFRVRELIDNLVAVGKVKVVGPSRIVSSPNG